MNMTEISSHNYFYKKLLDSMHDWVRVLDLDQNVVYMNQTMIDSVPEKYLNKKCFQYLDRSDFCENCTSKKVIEFHEIFEKEEIINDKIFSVISSPLKTDTGEVIGIIEVLRDITDYKKLQFQIIEHNEKLVSDLNLAKRLQNNLLPYNFRASEFIFSFFYKSCDALGGDFLDIFKLDEFHYGVYIADVSGHGIPAAMLTIFLSSSFDKNSRSPSQALKNLYMDYKLNYSDQDLYITVFYGILNILNNTFTYSNAGHNCCPIVFNNDRFEILRAPGVPISNWVDEPNYSDNSVNLFSDDKIFLYTDGIIELKNKENIQFGEGRLLEVLQDSRQNFDSLLSKVFDAAFNFSTLDSTEKISDDISMLLIQI